MLAVAVARSSVSTSTWTVPPFVSTRESTFDASIERWAPMNASTVLEFVASASTIPTPTRAAKPRELALACAWSDGALASMRTLAASMSTPSPT